MADDPFWSSIPAFAISGFSGSGKTTLIEQLLPLLLAKGLKVAVLKHDVNGVQIDLQGKDSDRFYRAGGDVILQEGNDCFIRQHGANEVLLQQSLQSLSRHYDLVLVEGHKEIPLSKIWLLGEGESQPPTDKKNLLAVLPRQSPRLRQTMALLDEWLSQRWRQTPVYGGILIGGKSSRMGRPKHLLEHKGCSWLEQTLERVASVTDEVVILGKGEVPAHLSHYPRLPDIGAAHGPLAGMVAAMRWAPDVSWLMCACDMPCLSVQALRWLLESRQPGVWATLPDLYGDGRVEPLLAHYDPRAATLLEALLLRRIYSPSTVSSHPKVKIVIPPESLHSAWRNINDQAQLVSFEQGSLWRL